MTKKAATAAIQFALDAPEGLAFLRCWHQKDFELIRTRWPDAPAAVFVGVDPNFRRLTMTTAEVAEYMLETGVFYTAASLSAALDIPIDNASGKLFNIRNGKKYQTEQKGKPVAVRLTAILDGRKSQSLWSTVLTSVWESEAS